MEKSCGNCINLGTAENGKHYCLKPVALEYACAYFETVNPFEKNVIKCCTNCKHIYTDGDATMCGCAIGNLDYCCPGWELKASVSTPLNPSNSSSLDVNPSENLKYICQNEPFENRIQQLAEEAAELAQAALKYNRSLGYGCYTPVNRKDAADSVIEEMADVLLCMAAAFPDTERYKDFHVNLTRIYKEKETRWAERIKEHGGCGR